MPAARDPPLVVETSIANHLEILGRAGALRVRVRPIERVGHADPLDRLLGHAVHHRRLGDPDDVEDRGYPVDGGMELEAGGPDVREPGWPAHDHPVARSSKMRRDLLDPLKGRIPGPRPTDREVRAGPGQADLVDAPQARLDRRLDSLHRGELADRAAE